MDYLGKLSLETDYDWYIKSHKNYFPETRIELENLCKKYKKFRLLPSNASHHQIIKEKIDLVLTCYGTIGWEYPFLGVPVLLSSVNHPYVNYNFNIKPKNFDEYNKILRSLDKSFLIKQSKKINKQEICEYYFMNYLFRKHSWLLTDLNSRKYLELFHLLRTRNIAYSNKIYQIWMKNFTTKRHRDIINMLDKFFNSNKTTSSFL
jgi:hypothetical protein